MSRTNLINTVTNTNDKIKHLNGIPLLSMKDKTAKVLLGKYLTVKPSVSPIQSERKDVRSNQSPPQASNKSFNRDEPPRYAKPLRSKNM